MNKKVFRDPYKRMKTLVMVLETHDPAYFLEFCLNDLESGIHGKGTEYVELKDIYDKMVKDEELTLLAMSKTILQSTTLFTTPTVEWAYQIFITWRLKKGNNKA